MLLRRRANSSLGFTPLLLAITALRATPAVAQDWPKGDVAGCYAVQYDGGTAEWNKSGWVFSGTVSLTGWASVVGEVGGSSREHDISIGRVRYSLFSVAGGFRFRLRRDRLVPFGQFLVGTSRRAGSLKGEDYTGSWSSYHLLVQPGAGLDVIVARHAALRLQVDFPLRLFFGRQLDDRVESGARGGAGLAVTF